MNARRTPRIFTAFATSVALVAALTTMGQSQASAADQSAEHGFSDGTPILTLSAADLDRELDAVVATGGTWLRVPFNWGIIESSQGVQRWQATDRVVAAAKSHGLDVLGVISYAPAWARAKSHQTAPPKDPSTFGTFAGQVVTRYQSAVSTWEIWNEPNIASGFGGKVDAKAYVRLLKSANAAIKAIQPGSTVVSGGLNRGPQATGGLLSYVRAMYAAGARGHFDALGVHPYLRATTMTGAVSDQRALMSELEQIRLQMLLRWNLRPIWFTEYGVPTPIGISQQDQADVLTMQFEEFRAQSWAGPSIFYTIRDTGSDPRDPAQNFGSILTHDWQPKLFASRL